jgi:hypothetical protein
LHCCDPRGDGAVCRSCCCLRLQSVACWADRQVGSEDCPNCIHKLLSGDTRWRVMRTMVPSKRIAATSHPRSPERGRRGYLGEVGAWQRLEHIGSPQSRFRGTAARCAGSAAVPPIPRIALGREVPRTRTSAGRRVYPGESCKAQKLRQSARREGQAILRGARSSGAQVANADGCSLSKRGKDKADINL